MHTYEYEYEIITLDDVYDNALHHGWIIDLLSDIVNIKLTTIAWFRSYLENRYFIVNVGNSFSEKARVVCGVPQDSILGPLIFLIYAHDMPQAVKCDLYLYADDSCLPRLEKT